MKRADFSILLSACDELAQIYEPDITFIGGIAGYLHSVNHEETRGLARTPIDADFYISMSALSDLRDEEELTQNSRLSKHEFQKAGFSFYVYAERQAALPVPYAEVAAYAVKYDNISVASLEDLLTLKLEAATVRHNSVHGQKDAKDMIRILLLAGEIPFDSERAVKYMQDQHFERLSLIVKGPEVIALAQGNAKQATVIRQKATSSFERIASAY
jgi:hypothetical protein